MTKILFPTDFSKTAKNAYLYALTMARAIDADIIVLHSFLLPLIDESGIPANFKEVFDTIAFQNQERLDEHMLFLNRVASKRGFEDITATSVLKSGDLHLAMEQVVEQEGVNLAVMGTSGTTGWFESILGSQTGDAIASLSVPVMSMNTLRERLNGQVAAERWQFVPGTVPGAWLVYMGKYPSEDALVKKRLELRGLGLSVERIDSPALAPGLTLGSFPTQAAAQAALSKAEQRGVRTARVLQERTDLAGFWLKLAAADVALKNEINALLSDAVPGKRLQACR